MDRVRRAERIRNVQKQLKKLEDVRLSTLERERQSLLEARREVAAALGSDSELHGLFLDVMARRLGQLAKEEAVNDQKQAVQRERVLDRGRKERLAERLFDDAVRELDTEQQRRLLAEISDRFASGQRR